MSFIAIGAAALILDALLGDPRWFPHPVRLIGAFCGGLEPLARRALGDTKLAGAATVAATVAITGAAAYGLVAGACLIHPALGWGMEILLAYFAISMRDLADHALAVKAALDIDDLALARRNVAMMVGRDTADLPEQEVVRAAAESVAENSVDGVMAPIFYIAIGGGVGAMVYKAVSTMDSMFGYKNEKYLNFGWAAARLDDLANYIPARLAALAIPLAAMALGQDGAGAWRIMRRDGGKHASPNSGLPEAAFAGALGVRFGGVNRYAGVEKAAPYMGEAVNVGGRETLAIAIKLMVASSLIFFLITQGAALAIRGLYPLI